MIVINIGTALFLFNGVKYMYQEITSIMTTIAKMPDLQVF